MKFSQKIFISAFCASILLGSALIWTAYSYVTSKNKENFISRYSILSQVLGDTLTRLDMDKELLMLNAAKTVVERDAQKGLLTHLGRADL